MSEIWEAVQKRIDYSLFVPRLIPDHERFEYRTRTGELRISLKNPRGDRGAGTYVLLEEADEELLRLMDGERTIARILVDHLTDRGVFALDRLGRLTATLAANGFFGEERPNVFQRLRLRRALRRPLTRVQLLLRRAIMWHIASWPNVHGPVDVAYRLGGRLFFTRPGALALAAFIALGLGAWLSEMAAPRHDLLRLGGSYTAGLVVFVALLVIGLSLHEMGHALAIRHYGRRVRRLGLSIYYLMPCAYVDSTDMVMAPRRARIVVDAAGAVGGFALAALAGIIAMLAPAGSIEGSIALKAATLFAFQNAFQLLPILELDGYHLLVDALDLPLLRQRAMTFARTRLLPRLRSKKPMTREEIGLAVFGVLAIASSVAMLALGLWIWQARLHSVALELWEAGAVGRTFLVALALVFLGPLVLGLAAQLVGWGSALLRPLRRRGAEARRRMLLERTQLLARTAIFRGLRQPELAALASHCVEQRVAAGESVVREGEEGERFYVVAEGEADVLIGPEERKVNELRAGDSFGEIALLQRVPRTATVRAQSPMRLFALDRAHFTRWAADRTAAVGRLRASIDERERLLKVPVFASLSPGELDRIAARLRVRTVPAGEQVVAQGEPGDRFYVIAEGTAEVLIDERHVRDMGPGEFFGELALLTRGPRTATVRASTDLVLYSLAPEDLGALLQASADANASLASRAAIYERAPDLAAVLGRN